MSKEYTLCYWPGIPGRGEFVRLAFEYAQHPYKQDLDPKSFMKYMKDPSATASGEPYALAPPFLLHDGHLLSQTPNILLYIGETLGLSGSSAIDKYHVNSLTLTALDLNNEIHDSHHPVAVSLYYEDQKDESKRKSKNIREERIPKFLGYYANILNANSKNGVLVGSKMSYADLALFQVVDGMQFAFPKRMKTLEQDSQYKAVFDLKKKVQESEGIAAYLKSDRRQKYSMGVFRYYPELDDE